MLNYIKNVIIVLLLFHIFFFFFFKISHGRNKYVLYKASTSLLLKDTHSPRCFIYYLIQYQIDYYLKNIVVTFLIFHILLLFFSKIGHGRNKCVLYKASTSLLLNDTHSPRCFACFQRFHSYVLRITSRTVLE